MKAFVPQSAFFSYHRWSDLFVPQENSVDSAVFQRLWWYSILESQKRDFPQGTLLWASQVMLVWKNLPACAGDTRDMGLVPQSERSSGAGKANALQYFFLGKFHGQRSLMGYSPWGCEESDTTEHTPAWLENIHHELSVHTELCSSIRMTGMPTATEKRNQVVCRAEGGHVRISVCFGNPLQRSCLENPRDGGGPPSTGSHRVGHDWDDIAAAAAAECPKKDLYPVSVASACGQDKHFLLERNKWKQFRCNHVNSCEHKSGPILQSLKTCIISSRIFTLLLFMNLFNNYLHQRMSK